MFNNICITGTDHGLGFELVRIFAASGCQVFAGHLKNDSDMLFSLREKYPNIICIPLDISSDKSVSEFAEKVNSITDSIDLLLNNAAILGNITSTVFDTIDFGDIQKVFNVTALGALRTSNALISLILKSETKLIVNISSEASQIGSCYRSSWFAYCMSKAALNMQASIVHNGICPHGGQVLQIHPGWVKTYMQGKLDEKAELTPAQSAAKVVERIYEYKKYAGSHPVLMDESGNIMNW